MAGLFGAATPRGGGTGPAWSSRSKRSLPFRRSVRAGTWTIFTPCGVEVLNHL